MKHIKSFKLFVFFGFILLFSSINATEHIDVSSSSSKMVINSISGQVWSPYNQPVSEIQVELLNELYITVARYRTRGGGRYEFSNISSGLFKVKVLTYGTDYEEQVKDVQIINIFQGASDQQIVDFYLKFDPRKVRVGSGGLPVDIFVQEVPEEARKLYKKGRDLLASNQDKGFEIVEQSLQIYPIFFDALSLLGKEYVQRKEYQKALTYLVQAIDINQRSFSSYYDLAYACYQLNQKPEAIVAARAATIIKPASFNAQLLYGTVLRISGDYKKAEQVLIKAKDLGGDKPAAEVFMQLALLYNKLDRNKEAADALERFLKLAPKSQYIKEITDLIAKLRNAKT